ncbi:hypothetical protein Godav_028972 [Gossypium davidsonii]|uniref:Uncharacterized protein n=1 Tax=Gossypium davidsonii TaxID=34287 RepID=A0A7J8THJ4_GOSDV|nr:hypothetical protein [Gossypium davidsonii]
MWHICASRSCQVYLQRFSAMSKYRTCGH